MKSGMGGGKGGYVKTSVDMVVWCEGGFTFTEELPTINTCMQQERVS